MYLTQTSLASLITLDDVECFPNTFPQRKKPYLQFGETKDSRDRNESVMEIIKHTKKVQLKCCKGTISQRLEGLPHSVGLCSIGSNAEFVISEPIIEAKYYKFLPAWLSNEHDSA